MRRITYTFSSPQSQNPFVRILALIGVILLLAVSVVVGAFLFAALFGLAIIAGGVLYLRLWWLRRQWRRRMADNNAEHARARHERPRSDARVIEGEFVREDSPSNRRR